MTLQGWLLVIAAGAVIASSAAAGAAPWAGRTVKVGPFTKKTVGTVKSITDGDAGCYYELKDAKGATFTETAVFDLCDPKKKRIYRGKKVSLTYKIEKVMADDCEGNPDCKRHKHDAIIKQIKIIK